ncbi:MAG: metallophosphoesterase [Candidatus Obscuribacterales bacterium]|nr:metallophosphoesterase [Candidatus Obscuribacterales bacterium]
MFDPSTHPIQYTYGLLVLAICALCLVIIIARSLKNRKLSAKPFVITPYLQLGPNGGTTSDMELRWLTAAGDEHRYQVVLTTIEPASCPDGQTLRIHVPVVSALKIHSHSDIALDTPRLYRSHVVALENLPPDTAYAYEIWRDSTVIFSDQLHTRKAPHQAFRFVAVGDPGTKGDGQTQVAQRVATVRPDLIVQPGDIVYKQGLFSEYLSNFFPFQSKLLSRYLSVQVLGNHDVTRPDFRKAHSLSEFPDSLAWYYVWSLPLNGPRRAALWSNVEPLRGARHLRRTFKSNTNARYPGMGNYSFDYGLAHFVVLDANVYMDWSDSVFRQWLQNDLSQSQAKWKIVVWHQPSFTSHLRHRVEQRMRLVADIIQNAGVKLVLTGHAHHYERSFPLNFHIAATPGASLIGKNGNVEGDIQLDKDYDGVTKTKPQGPIYIVTGGGGAPLSIVDRDVPASSDQWQSFTNKLVFDRHSFSIIDVNADSLTVRQMAADGEVFDSFMITQ